MELRPTGTDNSRQDMVAVFTQERGRPLVIEELMSDGLVSYQESGWLYLRCAFDKNNHKLGPEARVSTKGHSCK